MFYGAAVAAGMTLPALGGVLSLWASGAIPSESFGGMVRLHTTKLRVAEDSTASVT